MANPVDVSEYGVMIGFYEKVALYSVYGNFIGERTFSNVSGYSTGLDGHSLYYITRGGNVVRIDADTGANTGIAVINARYAHDVVVSGGVVAKFYYEWGEGLLSVYDMIASTYIVDNVALPAVITSNRTYIDGLIGLHGNNAIFHNYKHGIFSYDFVANRTTLLLEKEHISIAAEDGSSIAYSYQGDLHILNLTTNISTVEIHNFKGSNMQIFGDYVVYDYYDTIHWPQVAIVAAVIIAIVAVAVVAIVLYQIKRRRGGGR